MSCEICGRNNCTRSFHSFEEQDQYDEIKERAINRLKKLINRLNTIEIENNFYVDYAEVIDIIET